MTTRTETRAAIRRFLAQQEQRASATTCPPMPTEDELEREPLAADELAQEVADLDGAP